jgi:hypothetical protein
MPNWFGPLLVFIGLVAFMGYAFRQGTKVKPDRDARDSGIGGDISTGSDGHGGH